MRWEYADPEKKTFVFNAGLLLSYFPEDNQLWRQKVAPESNMRATFRPSSPERPAWPKNTHRIQPLPRGGRRLPQLKLTPRRRKTDAYILLEIDQKTWMLRRAVLFDWAGNKTEFGFSGFKTNAAWLDDRLRDQGPSGLRDHRRGGRPRKK